MTLHRMAGMVVLLVATSVASLSAQGRTATGIAVDSSNNKPLQGAVAYADRVMGETRAGKDGKFSLAAQPVEEFFVVRVPGYVPARVPWSQAGESGDVGTVKLRKAKSDADKFAIQTEDLRVLPQLAPFYERKGNSRQGSYLTPDDIALAGAQSRLSEVIRRTSGMQSLCVVTRDGEMDCGKRGYRGPTSITNQPAQEQVCVASVWTYGGLARRSIDEVTMAELLAVESYPSPGATPADFSGDACAVIVLWVKR